VTVTVIWFENVPAFKVKVAVVAPAATMTLEGVDNRDELSEMLTELPFVSAARRTVTVQLVDPLSPTLEFWQASEVTLFGASREIVACWFVPPMVAARVAV